MWQVWTIPSKCSCSCILFLKHLIGKHLNVHFLLQVCGIKAPSPLLQLPSFDIVNGIAIDAMHCVYLGVVKQLLGLWFNSKHSGQRWYCGNRVEMVDKRLLEIKPPNVITRIPRSIQHHVKFWKGNQVMRPKLKLNWLFGALINVNPSGGQWIRLCSLSAKVWSRTSPFIKHRTSKYSNSV